MEKEQKDKNKRDEEQDELRPQRDNESGGDGMPRFSFMWIYILIGLALLGLQMTKFMGGPQKANMVEFDKWARKGHIDRLVVINNEEAQLYIKRDSLLQSADHTKLKPELKEEKNKLPQYVFNFGNKESLENRLKEINEALSKEKEKKSKIIAEYDPQTRCV